MMSKNSFESESVDSDDCERLLKIFFFKVRKFLFTMILLTDLHIVAEIRINNDT